MSDEVGAGRTTDERIAVDVMGLCVHDWDIRAIELDEWDAHCRKCGADRGGSYAMLVPNSNVPKYSTDISAAWQVVEKIQRRHPGWRFMLLGGDVSLSTTYARGRYEVHEDRRVSFGWHASFFGHIDPRVNTGERHADEHADTAPLAICRAALRAIATQPESEIPGPHGEPRT